MNEFRQGNAATENKTYDFFNESKLEQQMGKREENNEKLMATKLKLCEGKFTAGYKKIRGRCHITGRHMEAAHQACKVNVESGQLSFMSNISIFSVIMTHDSFLNF